MTEKNKQRIGSEKGSVEVFTELKVKEMMQAKLDEEARKESLHEVIYRTVGESIDDALVGQFLDFTLSVEVLKEAKMFYSEDIKRRPATPDGVMTLPEIYKMARTDKQLKQMISQLRATRAVDEKQYKEDKKCLPYVVPGGEFELRRCENLIKPSGLASLDFDNIDIDPHELLEKLKSDPCIDVLFGAESPSGVGLKTIIAFNFMNCPFLFEGGNSVVEAYKKGYTALLKYIKYRYGYEADKSCKDISRAMFLMYDEKAYINPLLIGEEPNEFNKIKREAFDFEYWYNFEDKVTTTMSMGELDFDGVVTEVNVEGHKVSNVTDGSILAQSDDVLAKVEAAISYLETHEEYRHCTDDRDEWIMLGMALISMFEEGGRNFYHRLSRLSTKYDITECNDKYDELLRNSKRRVKAGTFFDWVKKVTGKKVVYMVVEQKKGMVEQIFEKLPPLLKKFVARAERAQEQDMYFIGSMCGFGPMFDKVKFYHKDGWLYPNFYIMVVGDSTSGKSTMKYVRVLFERYDEECKKPYKAELMEYKARCKGRSNVTELPPVQKSFMMAGDVNSPTMCDFLEANNGRGLIIETEAMSMLSKVNMKNDSYGSLLKNLLLAYANEPISYMRKKDNQSVEVKVPKLGVLISGTPNWIPAILKHRDSGLLSRFSFLSMDDENGEFDFSTKPKVGDKSEGLAELQEEVCELADCLARRKDDLVVEYTGDQNDRFDKFFNDIVKKYGKDMKDIILRHALNAHKWMVILSVLRRYEAQDVDLSRCESISIGEDDFELGLMMGEFMLDSTLNIITKHSSVNNINDVKGEANKQKFFESLPAEGVFSRAVAVNLGKSVMGWESAWVDIMLRELKQDEKLLPQGKGKYIRASQVK